MQLLIECFDRRCKLLGEEHQATQNTMTEISIEFANQSKLKESLEWTLRCSSIQKRGGGDDHPQTSRMQNNLGILYLMLGDFASALPHIQAASNVYQRTLGPDHMLTLVILANLGNTYRLLGQYVEAERILLDCLQRIQTDDLAKAVCTPHVFIFIIHCFAVVGLRNLGQLYLCTQDYERALNNYKEGLALMATIYSRTNAHYTRALPPMFILKRKTGCFDRLEEIDAFENELVQANCNQDYTMSWMPCRYHRTAL
ncbi:hypothetical protein AeRB84_008097 [Aphanomyces euteiches]|nr:hypothetical protein AeRB84_008097 [Aphanomyces euteiches]